MIFTIPVFIIIMLILIFSYKHFNQKQDKFIVLVLLYALFLLKLTEYTIYGLTLNYQKTPIEFSTMSYFVFSISIIFNIKWIKEFATFAAYISGVGYLFSFIFIGQSYFENQTLYDASFALINHTILFYTSILVMKHEYFKSKNNLFIYFMTILFLIYYVIMNQLISFNNPAIFINMLLQGDLLRYVVKSDQISTTTLWIYFICIILLYRFMIFTFHYINKKIYRSEVTDYEHTI